MRLPAPAEIVHMGTTMHRSRAEVDGHADSPAHGLPEQEAGRACMQQQKAKTVTRRSRTHTRTRCQQGEASPGTSQQACASHGSSSLGH